MKCVLHCLSEDSQDAELQLPTVVTHSSSQGFPTFPSHFPTPSLCFPNKLLVSNPCFKACLGEEGWECKLRHIVIQWHNQDLNSDLANSKTHAFQTPTESQSQGNCDFDPSQSRDLSLSTNLAMSSQLWLLLFAAHRDAQGANSSLT